MVESRILNVPSNENTLSLCQSANEPLLQLLNSTSRPGGVILLLTDGNEECLLPEGEGDDTLITDPELIAEIEQSGVRIVTAAFG